MEYPGMEVARTGVRHWKSGPLVLALLAQGVMVAAAGLVVVMTPSEKAEPAFEAAGTVSLPEREMDHRTAVAAFQQAAGASGMVERLTSASLASEGLPEVPSDSLTGLESVSESDFMATDSRALLNDSGIRDALGGLDEAEATASFFGIEDAGRRIVIVVNTSASVMNRARNRGVTVERIQEEIVRLVDGLGAGARFGVVQFSQGVRTFADSLVPATASNIDTVRAWVPDNLRGNPRASANQEYYGHEAGFAAAFTFDPDVVFLVTDGQLNRREGSPGNYTYPEIPYSRLESTLEGLRREVSSDVRINVVGFEMRPADADNMRRLAGRYGGRLREF